MVVKLEGKIDGNPIIFHRKEGDWWETTIPPNINGIYIVELVATDDAGNQGYACKYIITIDLDALCVRIKPETFCVKSRVSNYKSEIFLSNYYANIL